MSESKYINLKIRPEVHERLKAVAKTNRFDIQDFASDLLLMNLERYDYLREWAPNFSYEIIENEVRITDSKAKRIFTVRLTDHQLYCDDDKSTNCLHVQFALATPELAKIWLNKKE